ncbi:transmembrane protein 134 isoform X11 [Balaenoptera musculus]|uniref:Transmembrane protein 134 isoform X11 n=1 Tax=Balaenoptera musculus TaxID=9771 RepID=A0A8B8Y364_BALMU|nr:transmembrane protein 134 isoform X11 [Balaenoptera musculus]
MSAARPQFSIDDAFELSLEDAGPGPEYSGVARFGPLHFERRARFEVADEDKQSRLRYQRGGRKGLSPVTLLRPVFWNRTWRTMRMEPRPLRSRKGEPAPGILAEHPSAAPSGPLATSAPALSAPTTPAAGLSHAGGCGRRSPPCHQLLPLLLPSPSWLHLCAVLILTGVGLEVAPSPGVSSAIFFVPGFLLLVPGVYHVIFIYCAVKGHRGFQFFYLPYFEK